MNLSSLNMDKLKIKNDMLRTFGRKIFTNMISFGSSDKEQQQIYNIYLHWYHVLFFFDLYIFIHISYFKHIYTGYKFNKYIVLKFGPVKIKVPNKLFTNKLIDKNIYIWRQ